MSSRLQPPALGERQDRGPQHESANENRGLRHERRRRGHAGAKQDHQKEDAAGTVREGLDAGMQVDAVDRVIAQKSHEKPTEMSAGRPASRAGQAA